MIPTADDRRFAERCAGRVGLASTQSTAKHQLTLSQAIAALLEEDLAVAESEQLATRALLYGEDGEDVKPFAKKARLASPTAELDAVVALRLSLIEARRVADRASATRLAKAELRSLQDARAADALLEGRGGCGGSGSEGRPGRGDARCRCRVRAEPEPS